MRSSPTSRRVTPSCTGMSGWFASVSVITFQAHDRRLRLVVGPVRRFQRSASLRRDGPGADARCRAVITCGRTRPGATVRGFRRRGARRRLRAQPPCNQSRPARSDGCRRARQHLRERGAARGATLTAASRRRDRHPQARKSRRGVDGGDRDGSRARRSTLAAADDDDESRFHVRSRGERCPRRSCKGRIRRLTQAGRSTFYCPICQR